jgi:glycerophosphoryl diester phosphodiesterase
MHAARPRPGGEPGAVAIAHRAGNDRRALARALEVGADWIEADIWWQYGHLVARHERALWRLPVRYDEWKLAFALRSALRLGEICDLLTDGPQLLVDLKGSARRLPVDVVDCLRARHAVDRAAICGQRWEAIDVAVAREPRLRALYSVGAESQLAALRARRAGLPRVTAVSCAEGLLTPPVITDLLARGIAIVAWTVNDCERAHDLLVAGVSGITTDSPEVIRMVRGLPQPPRPS